MAFAAEHPILPVSEHRPVGEVERRSAEFKVESEFEPSGDQPSAIAELDARLRRGESDVVLMGATGTGKSATAAWLIEQQQRPTLVMAPNKTLAAQLANELRQLLPHNAVESSSLTTTTTSPRPISRRPIPTSRRIPPSMRTSSGCVTLPLRRCCPAATSS